MAYQFGQAYCRPWRVKGKKVDSIRKKTDKLPCDGTSVDQIISAQPGLVLITEGHHTLGAITFVDHVTNFVYMHLIKDFSQHKTLLAKRAYENKLMVPVL